VSGGEKPQETPTVRRVSTGRLVKIGRGDPGGRPRRAFRYFEGEHPEDGRDRNAVEAGRPWARGEIQVGEAHAAAIAAPAADYAIKAVTHAAGPTDPATARERERQHRGLPGRLRPVAFPDR
jgi:hypothetical protein